MSSGDVNFIKLFETKSSRVKGISFHPTRPWVLVSLHSGSSIQLWDYRTKNLIKKYEGHSGPVRSVAFHPNQPIFVSGGDDAKIKVWNYKEHRCLFTLSGHFDYIRTVEFHNEYPWILSCSDDQTIRIWNWQSRTAITELTGHTHYVMCARFHPKEDLVVSGSLDGTVRVWDISGLRKKSIVPVKDSDGVRLQNDIFGTTDAILKFKLESHERGVNWVSFHPTQPLIISGSDDRQIKIWRISDTKAWEVDTLRGHYNNVSCCIFAPNSDLILSDGEDKSIRIFDLSKRSLIHTHRRENDRFWFITAHPTRNIFAAGHDSGIIMFKLQKERTPFDTVPKNGGVFFVRDKNVYFVDPKTLKESKMFRLKVTTTYVRKIYYNPHQDELLVHYENNQFEVYSLSNNSYQLKAKGNGKSVAWVTRNRFGVLESSNQISIRGTDTDRSNNIKLNDNASMIFQSNIPGCILVVCDTKIVLFDIQQMREISETNFSSTIKDIIWRSSSDDSEFALVCKDFISVRKPSLEEVCSTGLERSKIKSAVFNNDGVLIYTTMSHIKYMLLNGDKGIIRTLEQPVYLVTSVGSRLTLFTRDSRYRSAHVDITEMKFKQALINEQFDEVYNIVNTSKLIGQSIISYLRDKGYPKIALYFVDDERTKFDLSIECGDIDSALESAKKLDDNQCWQTLAQEALRQGNHKVVELAYNKTKDKERLSFLYLITGNINSLSKMKKDKISSEDIMHQFHLSLYTGDVNSRVKMLEQAGQFSLALLCAKSHGLEEDVERITRKIINQRSQLRGKGEDGVNETSEDILKLINVPSSNFDLSPPQPLQSYEDANWPLLTIAIDPFQSFSKDKLKLGKTYEEADLGEIDVDSGWGDVDILEETPKQTTTQAPKEDLESEWDLELDINPEDLPIEETKIMHRETIPLPKPGKPYSTIWCSNSEKAPDHIASGSFDTAMQILQQKYGIYNFEPLKPFFLSIASSSSCILQGLPTTPYLTTYVQRNWRNAKRNEGLPQIPIQISHLTEHLQYGYRYTTSGKFQDALKEFIYIIQALSLVSIDSKQELSEVKELVGICAEYILGIQIEIERKELQDKEGLSTRVAELAALFTHCELQPLHSQLTLRSAMNIFYKLNNFGHSYNFGRRLLALAPKQEIAVKVKQVMALCEKNKLNNEKKVEYDERNPFTICGYSYTPIYKGSAYVLCRYCRTKYLPTHKGKICNVCKLGRITSSNK